MGDKADQIGKIIKKNQTNAQHALKRYVPLLRKIESVRDTFDSDIPFDMEFNTKPNESIVTLSLFFQPPGPTTCCEDFLCSACESFNSGDQVITLNRGYIANSVSVYINGHKRTTTDYTETSPSGGVVTLIKNVTELDVVRICYVYQSS